jgi:putative acetyltransferase
VTPSVRPAREEDAPGVRALLTAAFLTHAEADLVQRLQADGDMVIEFVAAEDGRIVGYVGLSRMNVVADGERVVALAVAPVAVLPSHQNRGVARRLMECGLAAANGRGVPLVFVLGDPEVYGRFGFRAETAAPFASPYAGPHFMAQWLSSARRPTEGRADYARAFADLG